MERREMGKEDFQRWALCSPETKVKKLVTFYRLMTVEPIFLPWILFLNLEWSQLPAEYLDLNVSQLECPAGLICHFILSNIVQLQIHIEQKPHLSLLRPEWGNSQD